MTGPVDPASDPEDTSTPADGGCPSRPPMPAHFRASYYWPQSLQQNPGLGLSIGYAILTVFGAGYAAWFYWILNVRFLELTDVADFLVIVFREPVVALFLLVSIPLFSAYMAVMYRVLWWGRWRFPRTIGKLPDPSKPPKFGPLVQRWLGFAFFLAYAAAFTQFYGIWSAVKVRNGEGHKVTLEMRPIMWPTDAPLRQDVLLLGTTGRFTIVYDEEENRAWSVPHDSIARILHPERRSKPRGEEGAAKQDLETAAESDKGPTEGAEEKTPENPHPSS